MKKLNIGCGKDYREGWVNLDYDNSIKADVYHNLNKYPYPFKENTFDIVVASQIIEHVFEQDRALEEIKRVLKPGGKFIMATVNKKTFFPAEKEITRKYHVKELDYEEFKNLIERHFDKTKVFILKGSEYFYKISPTSAILNTVGDKGYVVLKSFIPKGLRRSISAFLTYIGIKLISKAKKWIHYYLGNDRHTLNIEVFDPEGQEDIQTNLIQFARSLVEKFKENLK